MKLILFISIFSSSLSYAANEAGGGAHPCKEDFMNTVSWMSGQSLEKLDHLTPQDINILSAGFRVVMPDHNPNFTIAIKEKPIKKCPNTENPYACSRPDQNRLELYCSKSGEGWMSLDHARKVKYAIHELMWWSTKYNDANFYYSTGITRRLLSVKPLVSGSAADSICLESVEVLNRNYIPLRNLVLQSHRITSEQQGLLELVNKHADSCMSACDSASRVACQEVKQVVIELYNK